LLVEAPVLSKSGVLAGGSEISSSPPLSSSRSLVGRDEVSFSLRRWLLLGFKGGVFLFMFCVTPFKMKPQIRGISKIWGDGFAKAAHCYLFPVQFYLIEMLPNSTCFFISHHRKLLKNKLVV
jgi:hypothetical protein